jgi:hypothetical protein
MMLPQLTLYSDCELHLRVESAMVFIACSKVKSIDTMKGKLMLAWYQSA